MTRKQNIRLMEEILHQLIGSLSHYLQGHPRWLAGFLPESKSNYHPGFETFMSILDTSTFRFNDTHHFRWHCHGLLWNLWRAYTPRSEKAGDAKKGAFVQCGFLTGIRRIRYARLLNEPL